MPHIAISMYPGRDEKTKQHLAEKMKQCMIETLGVPAHAISVSIQDVAPENWAEFKRSEKLSASSQALHFFEEN